MFSSLLLYLFAAACGPPQDGLERRGIDVCSARPREHDVCWRYSAQRLCLVTCVAVRAWGEEWGVSARAKQASTRAAPAYHCSLGWLATASLDVLQAVTS